MLAGDSRQAGKEHGLVCISNTMGYPLRKTDCSPRAVSGMEVGSPGIVSLAGTCSAEATLPAAPQPRSLAKSAHLFSLSETPMGGV